MGKNIDPKQFGLTSRTIIIQTGENDFALVIDRKSRIIMADGKKILQKVDAIRAKIPGAQIHVHTSAPVCSKTKAMLNEHGVTIDLLVVP